MDVYTIGETMICFSTKDRGLLEYSPSFEKSIGGAESNTAIGLSRLGKRVCWQSKVGNDPFGREIIKILKSESIITKFVDKDSSSPTGLMIKERLVEDKVNVYYYRENSAVRNLLPQDIEEEVIKGVSIVHLTGITLALGPLLRQAVHKILTICKENNILVSFDLNYRHKLWNQKEAKDVFESVYPFVDILFTGDEEGFYCSNTKTEKDLINYYKWFCKDNVEIIIKKGKEGATAVFSDTVVQVPSIPNVKVIDTVGAGDAFNAGYLYGKLEGLSLEKSMEIGSWIASKVVSHKGDYHGLPYKEDLDNYLCNIQTIER